MKGSQVKEGLTDLLHSLFYTLGYIALKQIHLPLL